MDAEARRRAQEILAALDRSRNLDEDLEVVARGVADAVAQAVKKVEEEYEGWAEQRYGEGREDERHQQAEEIARLRADHFLNLTGIDMDTNTRRAEAEKWRKRLRRLAPEIEFLGNDIADAIAQAVKERDEALQATTAFSGHNHWDAQGTAGANCQMCIARREWLAKYEHLWSHDGR
jgi:hypothetical protein